jgi:hypothetical protein
MSTPIGSTRPPRPREPGRGPLRLRIAEHSASDRLDGGWWPRSRDLAVELAELAGHFPAGFGRIVRAVVSRSDWDSVPDHVMVPGSDVTIEPGDDTHLILLTTSDRSTLRVLVVPPGFTSGQGAEALLAAATTGNGHSAADLLEEVTENVDVDPGDLWTDNGDTWWVGSVAPSFRTGR